MGFAQRLRKLASETAIYGISSIIGRAVQFLIFPFYTWFFAPEELGIYAAAYAGFVVFNIIYTYGMEAAYLKFASGKTGRKQAHAVFSTITWMLIGSSLALSLVFLLFKSSIGNALNLDVAWHRLLHYIVLILVMDTLCVVPFAELRLSNQPIRFAVIQLTHIFVNVGLNVLLIVAFGMGIEAIFMANVASSAVKLVMHTPTYLHMLRLHFDGGLWRELLHFGLPFLPSGLGYAATETISRVYIGKMDGVQVLRLYSDAIDTEDLAQKAADASELARTTGEASGLGAADLAQQVSDAADAVYGSYMMGVLAAGFKIAIFMTLFAQMFRFAWQPFFLQHAEDEDAQPLFAQVFTLFTAVGLGVWLTLSFFVDELVALPLPGGRNLIDPAYWLGLRIVPILLLAYLLQGWYYNFAAGLYITKKTKYFVYCSVGAALITIGMNVGLVPRYGMTAAAWAAFAAYATMAGMLFFISRHFYPVPYAWGRVALTTLLAAGLFLLWWQVPGAQVWWVELLLVGVYGSGLVVLGVVPKRVLLRLLRR